MSADLAIVPATAATDRAAAEARYLHPSALPHWRALLEAQRQDGLEQVTELALAYNDAEEAAVDPCREPATRQAAWRQATRILRRTSEQQRALAEIDAALTRLAIGRFGWCEHCGGAIDVARLTELPPARYCAGCARSAPGCARSARRRRR